MSYIKRLIKRAVDRTINLENNTIGCYGIKPRHGYNLYVYDISYITEVGEKTIITFKIDAFLSKIDIYGFTKDKKALQNCFDSLVEIYPDFNIDAFYSELKQKHNGKNKSWQTYQTMLSCIVGC